jgi:hypothetical protein
MIKPLLPVLCGNGHCAKFTARTHDHDRRLGPGITRRVRAGRRSSRVSRR